ncbi:hypothetical protein M5D96_012785, partial [Drosophila gunungcola]
AVREHLPESQHLQCIGHVNIGKGTELGQAHCDRLAVQAVGDPVEIELRLGQLLLEVGQSVELIGQQDQHAGGTVIEGQFQGGGVQFGQIGQPIDFVVVHHCNIFSFTAGEVEFGFPRVDVVELVLPETLEIHVAHEYRLHLGANAGALYPEG